MDGYKVIGQRVDKVDALERVTGEAVYGADVRLPGMLYGKVLYSPHPHARIRRIDYSKALQHPGVVSVATAGDLASKSTAAEAGDGAHETGSYDPGHESEGDKGRPNSATSVFASSKVLWVGQPVAAVAATTTEAAEEAVELIDVEYELLTPLFSAEESMKPDAPLLHPNLFTQTLGEKPTEPSNIATHIELSRGDLEEGFKQADVIIEDTYSTVMVHQAYLEPRATLADVDANGKITVWSSSQGSFRILEQLNEILDEPLTSINVIPVEMGGGFGAKTQGVLEPIAILLSRKSGRPVKMVVARDIEFKIGRPGAPSVFHVKLGATKEGKLTAAHIRVTMEGGAFPGGPVSAATNTCGGAYKIPNLLIEGYDVVVNKPPVGSYRAPGAPQAAYAFESHMDRLARALNMDPLELRLMNVAAEGDRMPTDMALPRVGFRETLEKVKTHPAWTTPLTGPNRGRGLASATWLGGAGPMGSAIRVNGDGTLAIIMGAIDISGSRTALVQLVAEEFGVEPSQVTITIPATDTAPYATVSAGSKVTMSMSAALKNASDKVKQQLIDRGAAKLDVPTDQVEYQSQRVQAKGDPSRFVTMRDLASDARGPIMETGSVARMRQAPQFGVDVVDIEVDPETGKVTILNFTAFQDCGLAVNPTQIEGQMQGGVTQGIGWALTEEYIFDNGNMKNASFLDYRIPTSLDLPMIQTELIEVPASDGPYGIRGVGEMSIVPPMAAIANALFDATSVRFTELPMSPEKVLLGIQKSKNGG